MTLKLDRETKIGKEINEILKSYKTIEKRATHLLFSLNRWEKREELMSSLESGVNLVIDRYAFSGVVYSICNVMNEAYLIFRELTQNGVCILTKGFLVQT